MRPVTELVNQVSDNSAKKFYKLITLKITPTDFHDEQLVVLLRSQETDVDLEILGDIGHRVCLGFHRLRILCPAIFRSNE